MSSILTSGILKGGVNSFHEHMCVLGSHKVNPLNVPPSGLRKILLDVKDKIHSHHRLAQPDDPDVIIGAYYSVMQVSPIAMEDF